MGIGTLTIFTLMPRASIPAWTISSPAGRERSSPGISGTGWSDRTVSPAFIAPGGDRQGDVVQGSEGADERLHAVAEIGEHRGSLAAADSAEGEPRADGEVDGVDHRGERPQRERLEILPELHSLRVELRDHVPREEDEEPDLLELPDHRRRGRGVRRLPDHHGDPGNGAVHEVDPELAKDGIGDEARPRGAGTGCRSRGRARRARPRRGAWPRRRRARSPRSRRPSRASPPGRAPSRRRPGSIPGCRSARRRPAVRRRYRGTRAVRPCPGGPRRRRGSSGRGRGRRRRRAGRRRTAVRASGGLPSVVAARRENRK